MTDTKKICYKCLLEDLDEAKIYSTVKDMIDAIPDDEKTPEDEYRARLAVCRECDSLISGTCKKCGCYVELRAAGRTRSCPDVTNKWEK